MKTMYEVEWISNLPTTEYEGSDFDNATYEKRDFPNKGLAVAFAKKVGAASPMGEAWIQAYRETLDPESADWRDKGKWFQLVGRQEAVRAD